jgi:two-component system, cell cycle response regulator
VVKALDNGADDFIPKPPMVEELRARLRAADRLTSMQCELIKYATTDSLTGLLNRRAFLEDASEACAIASVNNPISTILFDIDHFKSINDGHGHEAGDVVLATVGTAAKMVANGTVGRLGGEEFCILERCDITDAVELAEALRSSVKSLKFSKGDLGSITCSFGVSEWEPGDTIDRLLRRADIAMYEAKSSGRDRVVATDQFAVTDQRSGWRDVTVAAKRASG